MPTMRTKNEQEKSNELATETANDFVQIKLAQHEQRTPHKSGSNQYQSVRLLTIKPAKNSSNSYPSDHSGTTAPTAATTAHYSCNNGQCANVMQPIRLIQANKNEPLAEREEDDDYNDEEAGSRRQAKMLLAISRRVKGEQQQQNCAHGSSAIKLTPTTSRATATCCKVVAPKCGSNQSSQRKCATTSVVLIASALTSSYFLLMACAILGRCAPTGTHAAPTPTTNAIIEAIVPSSHYTAHSEQVAATHTAKAHGIDELDGGQHHQHHHRHRHPLANPNRPPVVVVVGGHNQPIISEKVAGAGPTHQFASNSDSGLISVAPIIVLGGTPSEQPATTAHLKFSEQLKQERERELELEEANISSQTSAPSAHHHHHHHHRQTEDELAEDEQILLLLASDTASRSSFRRLIKRSGISDQRLAEIQMIRALKKQLERAASKIAAESNSGGGDGGAQESSAAAVDGQVSSTT